jgi:hypothetical protein
MAASAKINHPVFFFKKEETKLLPAAVFHHRSLTFATV